MKNDSTPQVSAEAPSPGVGSSDLLGFLLFYGSAYYPIGGWWDFKGSFASVELAKAAVPEDESWWHIIDRSTLKCVANDGASCYGSGIPPERYSD